LGVAACIHDLGYTSPQEKLERFWLTWFFGVSASTVISDY
jgi:hypothetical protein